MITQVYFEGDPDNDTNLVLRSNGRKDLLTVKLLPLTPGLEPNAKLAVFDVVLSRG